MSNEMTTRFRNMVKIASGMETNVSLMSAVRNTATGRLIAAGAGGRARATERLMENLLRRIEPENILAKLQDDAMGEEFLFVGRRNANNSASDEGEETATDFSMDDPFNIVESGSTVKDVFESITWQGKRIFEVMGVEGDSELSVLVRMTPHWVKGMLRTMRVRVDVPNPELKPKDVRRLSKDTGHMIVSMNGCQPRIYRPRLMEKDGKLAVEDFAGWLKAQILEAVRRMPEVVEGKSAKQSGGSLNANKVDDVLNTTILEAFLSDLQLIQQKTKIPNLPLRQTAAALINQGEFPMVVEDTKDVLKLWERRESLCRLAAAGGFDILSTSKNKPGEICTKAGSFGVPNYLMAINPFAPYGDPKRRPEVREIKQREPLFWTDNVIKSPTVRAKGTKLPMALAEGMREVVVMVADTNLNNFGQDTLTCTEALWENLKLVMFDIECDDMNQVEERLRDLQLQGFDINKVSIQPREDGLGGGLTKETWIITVEQEDGVRDPGKIKSCIGPIKGVPSLIPGKRFFTKDGREIELIVPRDTVVRKKALDFWLAAALEAIATAKGETEVVVDPEEPLTDLVARIKSELKALWGNEDGLQEIHDEKGNIVGHAFVGAVPFFRPTQTKIGTFRLRSERNPIQMEIHATIMAGSKLTLTEKQRDGFTELLKAFRGVQIVDEEVSDRAQ